LFGAFGCEVGMRIKLIRTILSMTGVLIFVSIYQHNQIVRLNYEKQRLSQKKHLLEKDRNELQSRLHFIKDYSRVESVALNKLKMRPTAFSQIITVTTSQHTDFFRNKS